MHINFTLTSISFPKQLVICCHYNVNLLRVLYNSFHKLARLSITKILHKNIYTSLLSFLSLEKDSQLKELKTIMNLNFSPITEFTSLESNIRSFLVIKAKISYNFRKCGFSTIFPPQKKKRYENVNKYMI